jgi:hypothetical protein
MQAEGVDPCAPGALDTRITDLNARSPQQREQIIGPAADRMTNAAGLCPTAGTPAPKQHAQRRKTRNAPHASATDDAKGPVSRNDAPGRQERAGVSCKPTNERPTRQGLTSIACQTPPMT